MQEESENQMNFYIRHNNRKEKKNEKKMCKTESTFLTQP